LNRAETARIQGLAETHIVFADEALQALNGVLMTTVDVGVRAPDFTRRAHDGRELSLQALIATGPVVLYFYPKDETPGCTAEACAFRDIHAELKEAGATVIGVSADDEGSHRQFADHHKLPFPLIADEDRSLRNAYGVKKTLGIFDGRKTFVIGTDGMVRHVFDSQMQATRHVDEALATVRALTKR
jgi:peroxiredoxin Q/BCP